MGKEKGKSALTRRSSQRPALIAPPSPSSSTGSRKENKRVSSACQRCKQKKTKCDGQLPCERCVNDDVVCEAGKSRTSALKHVTPQYAEMLETNLHASNETIKKLYGMLMEGGMWNLELPQPKSNGAPSVHGIASQVGCVRNSDQKSWPQEIDEFASQRSRSYHFDEASDLASSNAASSPAYSGIHDSPRSSHSSVPTTPAQQFGALDALMDSKPTHSRLQHSPRTPHASIANAPVGLSKLNTSMDVEPTYSDFRDSPQMSQVGTPQSFNASNLGVDYGQNGSSYTAQYRQDIYASSSEWSQDPTYLSAVTGMPFSFDSLPTSMDSGFCNPSEVFRQAASY